MYNVKKRQKNPLIFLNFKRMQEVCSLKRTRQWILYILSNQFTWEKNRERIVSDYFHLKKIEREIIDNYLTWLLWQVIYPRINIQKKASGEKNHGTARKSSLQMRHDPKIISLQCMFHRYEHALP